MLHAAQYNIYIVKFQGGANIQQGGGECPPPPLNGTLVLIVKMIREIVVVWLVVTRKANLQKDLLVGGTDVGRTGHHEDCGCSIYFSVLHRNHSTSANKKREKKRKANLVEDLLAGGIDVGKTGRYEDRG